MRSHRLLSGFLSLRANGILQDLDTHRAIPVDRGAIFCPEGENGLSGEIRQGIPLCDQLHIPLREREGKGDEQSASEVRNAYDAAVAFPLV